MSGLRPRPSSSETMRPSSPDAGEIWRQLARAGSARPRLAVQTASSLTAAELIVLQRETGQTLAAGQTVSRALPATEPAAIRCVLSRCLSRSAA